MQNLEGNWACHNFIERRDDFKDPFPYRLYYGKVKSTECGMETYLGYVVSEDELEEITNESI